MRRFESPLYRSGPTWRGLFWDNLGPASRFLLYANVAVFVVCNLAPNLGLQIVEWFAAQPASVVRGQVWRLVTYMFLHGSLAHIAFNMIVLYFFAPRLEAYQGTRRFLVFYLVCGTGAGVVHLIGCYVVGRPQQLMIGASGALYAVLCANAVYFPNDLVYIWGVMPLKMKTVVWIFGILAFAGTLGAGVPGVSSVTHLGGLLSALIWLYGPRWFGRSRGPKGPRGGRRRPARIEELYDDPHWRLDQ